MLHLLPTHLESLGLAPWFLNFLEAQHVILIDIQLWLPLTQLDM